MFHLHVGLGKTCEAQTPLGSRCEGGRRSRPSGPPRKQHRPTLTAELEDE